MSQSSQLPVTPRRFSQKDFAFLLDAFTAKSHFSVKDGYVGIYLASNEKLRILSRVAERCRIHLTVHRLGPQRRRARIYSSAFVKRYLDIRQGSRQSFTADCFPELIRAFLQGVFLSVGSVKFWRDTKRDAAVEVCCFQSRNLLFLQAVQGLMSKYSTFYSPRLTSFKHKHTMFNAKTESCTVHRLSLYGTRAEYFVRFVLLDLPFPVPGL